MELTVRELGLAAKAALPVLNIATTAQKNDLLFKIADLLEQNAEAILEANAKDTRDAEANGINPVMADRLRLTLERISAMAEGVRQVAALPDPIGEVLSSETHQNGMEIRKVRVPLGVIGMIFESRPNVAVDSAVLCLKAGNPIVLRGGREAIASNSILVDIMKEALTDCGLPEGAVGLVCDTSRESATELMKLNGLIDLLIPRGGAGLIKAVVENATVPVIETGTGVCHAYVDEKCDGKMAADIVFNAKTSRPSVCNSLETLLIHEKSTGLLHAIKARLDEKSVALYGDARSREILGDCVKPATEKNYATEYNDFIMNIKVVASLDEAIEHIAKYGTMHSEAIITDIPQNAERFLNAVDAAAVYHNVTTRYTDGFEFGLGAEIGISTQKMHARGPMGLTELTSVKYQVRGSGQVR